MRIAPALGVLLVAAAACRASSAADAPDADTPSFSTEPPDGSIGARAGRVLLSTCSGGPESSCHSMAAGGMSIPSEMPDLVDVASTERPDMVRVKPFDPDQSYLWLKVLGDGGIDGARMPKDQPPLDPDAAAVLLGWIEAGAP